MRSRRQFDLLRGERGNSLIEIALLLPFFLLLVMGAVDFGRAFYWAIQVEGAAQAGAEYGAQHPSDTTGMKNAANDAAPGLTLSFPSGPSYGCECPYSSTSTYIASCPSTPTSCPSTYVYRVNMTVQATYKTLFPWSYSGVIPSSFTLTSSAAMRSHGS